MSLAVYADSLRHLLAELERIDLFIQSRVVIARRLHATDEQFRGLYISDKELDVLLTQPLGRPRWAFSDGEQDLRQLRDNLDRVEREIADRVTQTAAQGIKLRLPQLAQTCQLEAFDVDCLLICMAPELDLRYERIYAYLQDDVTKKKPSVDLALNLLAPTLDAKLAGRERLSNEAPLLRYNLLELFDEPSQPRASLLGKCLRVDDRVSAFLLGSDALDARLSTYCQKVIPLDRNDGSPIRCRSQR